jgi:hypothetical protein
MCNIHFVFLEFYIWHLSPPNALDYPQSVINIWGFIFLNSQRDLRYMTDNTFYVGA